MMTDREIHSPELQTGMHIPKSRPACYVEAGQPAPERGAVTEGWPLGVKPGLRNPFHDNGRSCGAATTPALWQDTLRHTPGCLSCARARRALELAAGISGQYDAPFDWTEVEETVPWYEKMFPVKA
jgi:hypothetical protein